MKTAIRMLVVSLLLGCSTAGPTAPTTRIPNAGNLAWVFDTPRPSVVSAEILAADGPEYNTIRITWNDATDDESWTALYFTGTEFAMVLTAPGYAGTGTRSIDLPVPVAYTAVAAGAAWAAGDLRTPYSASVAITGLTPTGVTTTKQKGHK